MKTIHLKIYIQNPNLKKNIKKYKFFIYFIYSLGTLYKYTLLEGKKKASVDRRN
jgi:hypothetical protein